MKQNVAAAQDVGYEKPLVARLTIKSGKIASLAKSICTLANMEDPINQILKKTEVADDLVLEKTSCPLGVLLIVFESRPDALVQSFMKLQFPNGQLTYVAGEGITANGFLLLFGGLLQALGKYQEKLESASLARHRRRQKLSVQHYVKIIRL
ncbi:hypothetical protein ABZP36_016220 [Zizania latifolia]